VPLDVTLADCEAFLRGDYDDLPEDRCYMRAGMGEKS
jgi:F-type H+-transporting ATPase subunit beta